jgi:hypothetical protein
MNTLSETGPKSGPPPAPPQVPPADRLDAGEVSNYDEVE